MLKTLAMAAMVTTGAAPPPRPAPCITRQQIADISVVTMASTVETARNACRPHLPAAAYLATPAAAEFSGRLRTEARQRLESALAGVTRMAGGGGGMTPEAMESLGEEGIAEGVGADMARFLNPAICRDLNEIIEIGAVLTPDQMGRFFSAFGSLVDHILRILPTGVFGPNGHPEMLPLIPAPAATPTSFDPAHAVPRPGPTPAPEATNPPRPFLCRDGA